MVSPDTLVITSGRLGRVIRTERAGPADGFLVTIEEPQLGDGWAPHWAPESALREAVISVTVCARPYSTCSCGMAHLSALQLDALAHASGYHLERLAVLRHDALLAGVYGALDRDHSAPAAAIRAALLLHISQPAPADPPPCAVCVGTGTGLVDERWVHCCCGCPCCSCGQLLCDGQGCETVEALADALGVVVDEAVS